MRLNNKWSILTLIFLVAIITSCEDKVPKPPPISKSMKKHLDTLFRNSLDSLDELAEKECDRMYTKLLANAKDSMHLQRLREIAELVDQ